MCRRFACVLTIVVSAAGCATGGLGRPPAGGSARYEGRVVTEWLPDGREMRLVEDFTYVDATGRRWRARKNSTIDGASIPRALWWTGGPYEGTYRDASVIHDYYCRETPKTATWRSVHRVFYEAMLTSGVGEARALVMYAAVFRHGPRWPDPGQQDVPLPPPPPRTTTPLDEDMRRVEALVNSRAVTTPEDVEKLPDVITGPGGH